MLNTYLCDAASSLKFGLRNLNLYNGPSGWGTPIGQRIFTL
jgi:hypothetical protein